MVTTDITIGKVWDILREIPDPEIPVLTIVDLNVVKKVEISEEDGVVIHLRPTFSGCPALDLMRTQVLHVLRDRGVERVAVHVDMSSPWSTDDIPESARQKLLEFGIAPPPMKSGGIEAALARPVECPHCGSDRTRMDSAFGSTLCKQLFVCDACRQPFERFKPL